MLTAPGLKFEARLLASMLSVRESQLDYNQYLAPHNIRRSREFAARNAAILKRVEARTGVEGNVVVAIVLVETNLGTYSGRFSILNVLASQAVLDTRLGRELLTRAWPANRRSELKTKKQSERLGRRAIWARKELAALAVLSRRLGVRPQDFRGSPAGAMGMGQFMPTSALKWGVDGDRDGRLELHDTEDALFSVGNYLKEHGWKPGLSEEERMGVLWEYNHSEPYGRTVLEAARRLP